MYDGPEHVPFRFEAEGDGRGGALLLHGFTGTPAEMRPLGAALAAAGVTAVCPLLPGMGPEIDRLGETVAGEWLDATRTAWEAVDAEFGHAALVGFSLGGALALQLAAERPPDRLVLLAPFWKFADKRAALLPVLRFVMPTFKAFADADFADPAIREAFAAIDPTLDLDDPAVQARLREETGIPTAALVELQHAGKAGGDTAPRVEAPTLTIQGTDDDTSLPAYTRELVQRLPGAARLLEVPGDHQLVQPNRPSWPAVRDAVVAFAAGTER